MKKTLTVALLLAAGLTLAGCNKKEEPKAPPAAPAAEQPSTPAPAPTTPPANEAAPAPSTPAPAGEEPKQQ